MVVKIYIFFKDIVIYYELFLQKREVFKSKLKNQKETPHMDICRTEQGKQKQNNFHVIN